MNEGKMCFYANGEKNGTIFEFRMKMPVAVIQSPDITSSEESKIHEFVSEPSALLPPQQQDSQKKHEIYELQAISDKERLEDSFRSVVQFPRSEVALNSDFGKLIENSLIDADDMEDIVFEIESDFSFNAEEMIDTLQLQKHKSSHVI